MYAFATTVHSYRFVVRSHIGSSSEAGSKSSMLEAPEGLKLVKTGANKGWSVLEGKVRRNFLYVDNHKCFDAAREKMAVNFHYVLPAGFPACPLKSILAMADCVSHCNMYVIHLWGMRSMPRSWTMY
jgi:hypothetical protein